MQFPSRVDIPASRADLILEALTLELQLCELNHRFFDDAKIPDASGYAVQTVGRAVEYLFHVDRRVGSARNELGLAIQHLAITANQVTDRDVRSQLKQLHDRLCVLREKLV